MAQEVRVQALERQVWQYNHEFWSKHNRQFREGKDAFAQSRLVDTGTYAPSLIYW